MIIDFGGTDPFLRSLAFAGIFAGAGTLGWWGLNLPTATTPRQLATATAALATIPAAIVAPFQDGPVLTVLGLVSVVAFLGCAIVAVLHLLEAQRHAPAVSRASADSAAPRSRAATNPTDRWTPPAPLPGATFALGPTPPPHEFAFILDYSQAGRPYRLGADNRIGRDPGADLPIDDSAASQEHARITLESGRFMLHDLGSRNGTHLVRAGRRRRLGAPIPLSDLDIIEIGASTFVFINVETATR